MVRPIDYTIDVQNPIQRALQGYQLGQNIRQGIVARRLIEEQQERKKNFISDMSSYANKETVTAADTRQIYAKYPEFAQNIERGVSMLKDEQKQEYANQLMPFYTAVRTGENQYAKEYIERLQAAYENSGDKVQAERIGGLARSLEKGPQQAVLASRLILGPLMGDDFYELEQNLMGKTVQRQKTGMLTVRDKDTDQVKIVVGSYDPSTGQLDVSEGTLPENYEVISKMGETPEEQQQRKIKTAGGTEAVKGAVKAGQKYAEKSDVFREQIFKLDNAIDIIEKGLSQNQNLGLGWVRSRLPKFNPFAIRMQQAARELGLGVVQQVTFGALSEKELELAMATGMPTTFKPAEALKWLKDKRAAQQKLKNEMDKAAAFIGSQNEDGSFNTISDWKKMQLQQKEQRKQRKVPTQNIIEGF